MRTREPDQAAAKLLREVITKHAPALLPLPDRLDSRALREDELDALRDALVAELCATGLDHDAEPTPRGRLLEDLIDLLGALQKIPPDAPRETVTANIRQGSPPQLPG